MDSPLNEFSVLQVVLSVSNGFKTLGTISETKIRDIKKKSVIKVDKSFFQIRYFMNTFVFRTIETISYVEKNS